MIMSINDELDIIYDNVNIDEFDYSMRRVYI
jgi:hypothetical protein